MKSRAFAENHQSNSRGIRRVPAMETKSFEKHTLEVNMANAHRR